MPLNRATSLRRGFVLPVAVLLLPILLAMPANRLAAAQRADPALARAVAALLAEQNPDGSFAGFGGEPDPGTTTDAVIALAAAGERGVEVVEPIDAALGYLEGVAADYAASGQGQAAKLALAAVAAGRDPRAFGGLDLPGMATGEAAGAATPIAGIPGVYGDDLYDHALVLLALAASGAEIPEAAIAPLRSAQLPDGAWAFDGAPTEGGGDSNTTALLIQALVAAGLGDDPMVAPALDYLRSVQTDDGAFAYAAADPLVGDANSTALAVQAIVATGGDPASTEWRNAAAALAAFQNPSGGFRYTAEEPADNLFATLQAIPALAGEPLPVGPRCAGAGATPFAADPATFCIALPAAA